VLVHPEPVDRDAAAHWALLGIELFRPHEELALGDPDHVLGGRLSAAPRRCSSSIGSVVVLVSIGTAATAWATWGLLGFGFVAFLIQQLSLATGQLAPAMAAVSVCNPGVSVVLGILLYEERLTRPTWHVFVAIAALLAALAGATIITLANRETPMPDEAVAGDRSTPDPAPA
jgi:hypothetical protein